MTNLPTEVNEYNIIILLYYLEDIKKCFNKKEITMFEYIHNNDIEQALDFLNTIDNINFQYIGGQTIINSAVENNQYEITKKALENGANPNILTDIWCCPLVNAISRKNKKIVDLLLDYNVNVDIMYFFFDRLIEYNDKDLILFFLDKCTYEQLKHLKNIYPESTKIINSKILEITEIVNNKVKNDIGLWGRVSDFLN